MELPEGAKSRAELVTTRQFFADLEIRLIPIDEPISYLAANLLEEHRLADGLDLTDALIAATARTAGQTLATANHRHFRRIPNLDIRSFHPSRK